MSGMSMWLGWSLGDWCSKRRVHGKNRACVFIRVLLMYVGVVWSVPGRLVFKKTGPW